MRRTSELLSLGMYTKDCSSFRRFVDSCIGCAHVNMLLMVDLLSSDCAPGTSAIVVSTADHVSNETLALQRAGVRINFPKTLALFAALTHSFDTDFYMKTDSDTFVNVEKLLHFMPTASNATYVGKALSLFRYRNESFTYMQGGAYLLRKDVVSTLLGCRLPSCPSRFLEDIHNKRMNSVIHDNCTAHVYNSEDLHVGMCLLNVRRQSHACFATHRPRRSCPCPFSLHPLKSPRLMKRASRLVCHAMTRGRPH